jgi:SagB-type dehydrogenase family enzyme
VIRPAILGILLFLLHVALVVDDLDAMRYNEETKHSYASVRSRMHYLDWATKPQLYKNYPNHREVPMNRNPSGPELDALKSIVQSESSGEVDWDLNLLSELLHYSFGVTRRLRFGSEWMDFRAAASAGVLYPVETYVVTGGIENLPDGVYYYHAKQHSLIEVRPGDYRQLVAASVDPRLASDRAIIVMSAIPWRSAWKYQSRAYRYCLWDCGTFLSNLVACSTAVKLIATVYAGFIDRTVNQVIGVDRREEATLCVVGFGGHGKQTAPTSELPLDPVVSDPLSSATVDYPLIAEVHRGTAFESEEDLAVWRNSTWSSHPCKLISIPSSSTLAETIKRRGSTRRFEQVPIQINELKIILNSAFQNISVDFLQNRATTLSTYVIVNSVDGLQSGSYYSDCERGALELLRQGNFRAVAGHLCLEQPLPHDASAVIFLLSDLKRVISKLGQRGYRAVQLEAGLRGGRIYLAAYSIRLGATGLTFYDDEVVDFFSPHAKGKDAIFVLAIGKPASSRLTVSGR